MRPFHALPVIKVMTRISGILAVLLALAPPSISWGCCEAKHPVNHSGETGPKSPVLQNSTPEFSKLSAMVRGTSSCCGEARCCCGNTLSKCSETGDSEGSSAPASDCHCGCSSLPSNELPVAPAGAYKPQYSKLLAFAGQWESPFAPAGLDRPYRYWLDGYSPPSGGLFLLNCVFRT